MRIRLCIPWLLVSVAAVVWSAAAAWAQPPGGSRGGFSFDQVLQRHDKNDDGKVTREEWQGPEEIFGRMDQNDDGTITKEEFQARMPGRGGFGGRPGGFGGRPGGFGGRSGGFGGGRGGAGASGSSLEASPPLDVAGLLRLLDANQDGSVSKDEAEKFFEKADADCNDSLSKDELAKALAPPARDGSKQIDGPSVVEGQKAGIEVGQYAPDFELQPIEPYAKLRQWLGDNAPASIDEKVKLSQLVGKQPVLLLYGSYT